MAFTCKWFHTQMYVYTPHFFNNNHIFKCLLKSFIMKKFKHTKIEEYNEASYTQHFIINPTPPTTHSGLFKNQSQTS